MSFASELKKVGSIDEAQLLFEKEVARLGTMNLYRSSETRYMNRIEKVQNDIHKHLNKIKVHGVLFLYEDMVLPQFGGQAVTETSADLEADKLFFKRLFMGIAVWWVGLFVMAHSLQNPAPKVEQTVTKTEEIKQDEPTEPSNTDEQVWNEYRGAYTDQATLDEDTRWASSSEE